MAEHFGHTIGQSTIFCTNLHAVPFEIRDDADKEWTAEEDVCLYNNRDCPVSALVTHFGVKFNVINERLMDLSGVDETVRLRMLSALKGKSENVKMNKSINVDDGETDVVMTGYQDDGDTDEENGHFYCKITHELMVDPVILCDGQSYERRAIEEWFKDNDTSPNTGKQLKSKLMTTNFALRASIEKYRKERQNKNNKEGNAKARMEMELQQTKPVSPSIMDLVNQSGANGISLDELANRMSIQSPNDRSELLSKLDVMMNDFLIFIKDDRYYTL